MLSFHVELESLEEHWKKSEPAGNTGWFKNETNKKHLIFVLVVLIEN